VRLHEITTHEPIKPRAPLTPKQMRARATRQQAAADQRQREQDRHADAMSDIRDKSAKA
jgi:hypothetical protein